MRIAINGMGIAGPTLAYWLLRSGHEVTLIERAPQFRAGGFMIDFWGVGYTVAERMGLLPQVRDAGYSVAEVRLVDDRGRKTGGFPADVFRKMTGGRFTSLPRGDLAALIFRSIEGQVESLFGNTITAVEERESHMVASFEHGGPREFDLIVGADGLHSIVRKHLFGPESQFEKNLGYHVAVCKVTGYRPRDELVYIGYAKPGRQIARFSMRDDRTMFLFTFVDEHMPGAEPHDALGRKAVLRRVFDDPGWECPQILAALDTVDDVYFDRVSQITLPAWSKGRVVLVGDAAACVSLLAGEGSGLAMTEAYVLAGELNRAAGNYRQAFDNYERQLRPLLERKQASARKFAGAFSPRTRFGIWFRNQVTKLLAIPAAARFFVGIDVQDEFDLANYEM